jgi:hypothetical protein
VEVISADGHYIPPFIIFGGKCILAGWFDVCDEPDYTIGMSDSGYINDLLAFQWIQHFDRHIKRRMLGVKCLLLCDGYGSHMTYEFIDFCEKNLLQLSPNEEDSFHTCLAKLVKATKTQAILVEHLTERVRQSDAATLARQRRAQASRAHLRTGGIIRKEDVNRMKRVKQDYNELVEKNRLRP